MAVFGNFKGTTQSDFKIGKTGAKIHGGNSEPSANLVAGDIWLDISNSSISVYQGNSFVSIGSTLAELNVDDGTLFVDSANDTVSIGSTASNEKLFVNGSLRLGTNPAIKYSGAFLDVSHSNGTETVLRVRDNDTGTDPVFKIYSANNESEVFKVEGTSITVANVYILPTADGENGQVITTDGTGNLSFTTISATPAGNNTHIQFNDDGSFGANVSLTYNQDSYTLQTGVVRGVLFEFINDYGFTTESNDIVIDYGLVLDSNTYKGDFEFVIETAGVMHDSFRVASLPNAGVPGQMIFVTDESGGATMAFSDGSNWRRIQDRQVVS
jgi:hypothetical protein